MGRGLDGFDTRLLAGCAALKARAMARLPCATSRRRRPLGLDNFGGFSVGETPLPIPNRAVKPHSADGTWPSRAWESRSPPFLHRAAPGRLEFVNGPCSISSSSTATACSWTASGSPCASTLESRASGLAAERGRDRRTVRGPLARLHGGRDRARDRTAAERWPVPPRSGRAERRRAALRGRGRQPVRARGRPRRRHASVPRGRSVGTRPPAYANPGTTIFDDMRELPDFLDPRG